LSAAPIRASLGAAVAVSATLALSAAPAPADPIARAAAQCGTWSTGNGGEARFVNTYRVTCNRATRVARRAAGRRYQYDSFTCRPKQTEGISGLSYFCQTAGRKKTLGFIYRAP
jgi:hypothetical protein